MNLKALCDATIAGDLEQVRTLVSDQPELIASQNPLFYGWTPLHIAAAYAHRDLGAGVLARSAHVEGDCPQGIAALSRVGL